MLKDVQNYNCYEYLKINTEIYGDFNMMQHMDKILKRSEYLREIDGLAAYFTEELGLKKGDVYSVFMPNTPEAFAAFYAMNKIGVIANFIHPLQPAEVLRATVNEVGSKGLMVLDLLTAIGDGLVDTINDLGLPVLVCSKSSYAAPLKTKGLRIAEAALRGLKLKLNNAVYWRDIIHKYPVKDGIVNNADDIAVYLNGGGTTGKSKTIKLTNRAINELTCRVSTIDEIHVPGEECEVVVLPIFHCFGLVIAMHMAMCNAARIIPMMQFDAGLFLKLCRKYNVCGFGGIPVMFKKLMAHKDFDGEWIKNIRLMFCGGDDASEAFLEEFNSYFEKWGSVARLRQGYGLTEIGSVCCTNTNTDYRKGSIGRALDGIRVELMDDDHNILPNGEIGEFCISGPTIMQGYLTEDGPEDAGLYTDADGVKWVCSGDLGYRDDDGYYFFSGRKKRVIIISGYNVYPGDIEKALEDLPFIKDSCAVKGFRNGRMIIRLFLTFREKGDEQQYKKEIISLIDKNFSKFYMPSEFVVMDELPETPLMKIDFMKLQEETKDVNVLANFEGKYHII